MKTFLEENITRNNKRKSLCLEEVKISSYFHIQVCFHHSTHSYLSSIINTSSVSWCIHSTMIIYCPYHMSIICMKYLMGQFVQNFLFFDEYLPKPHSSYPVCSDPLDILI